MENQRTQKVRVEVTP